jgi:site-specific DNA-methyltransferase (adenine-specific)
VFCNPPYGRHIQDWVRKGYEESQKPGTIVVMLIPARTDTSYFHDYIFNGKADEVRFLRGRLKFTDEDGNAKDAAPFPSAVIVWRSADMTQTIRDMVLELLKGETMTANEIAATLADRGQQVSRSDVGPILTKAQAAGKVRNAGKRVCNVTGRSAIVWTAEN